MVMLSLAILPVIGVSYFPRTDPGQFMINLKAPSGTRLELTEELVARVEKVVRRTVSDKDLELIVSTIGITPDFTAVYNSNSAQHTAIVQVGLKENHQLGSYEYMDRVRKNLREELPEVSTYFQSGGLVDAILNLGSPAPVDIQVLGSNLDATYKAATEIARKVRDLPGVNDVLLPQDMDYPAIQLVVDREAPSQLGLSAKEVIENTITALTSNGMIAPTFWSDPKNGNDYFLTVQYPENNIQDLGMLMAIPLRSPKLTKPTRLDAVATIRRITRPTEVDHYQIRRVIHLYVSAGGEDLGRILAGIKKILAETKLPEGSQVKLRGMVENMQSSFQTFGLGLILSVVLVYLILVAQFQSFRDPFLILLAVPPGVGGVFLILWMTHTTLNVMSLMGIVMMVGIVVSDSILIVEFIRRLRATAGPCARP